MARRGRTARLGRTDQGKNIRFNHLEQAALVKANVACFMLSRADLTALVVGKIFVDSLPQIRRVLRRFEVPVAATLSSSGSLRVLLAAGKWLVPPKELK